VVGRKHERHCKKEENRINKYIIQNLYKHYITKILDKNEFDRRKYSS